MAFHKLYERAKGRLLKDPTICSANRQLFSEFLAFEEYKLKRLNGIPTLDSNSTKTLLSYVTRLRTVSRWFRNKPWRELTKADIQRVYDDLEEGRITTQRGKPLRDRQTYYRKIIRGKPFEMAGKKELVKEVMQFMPLTRQEEVRFIREEEFRRLVELTHKMEHRAFLWSCWDIGENATAILQLRKHDCTRQSNSATKDPEYLVNLRKETLKRSRKPRSELTNYPETVYYLDLLTKDREDTDLLFDFGPASAKKVLSRLARKAGVRCCPGGQPVTLKDLRSSMACDLLSKGWSRDEVNARLGHSPSSREIDRYLNYLAIDRARPKRKLHEHQIDKVMDALAQIQEREKRTVAQLHHVKESSAAQIAQLKRLVAINAQIAALGVEHQLGRFGEAEYARALLKSHRELLVETQQMEDLERITN